MSRQDDETTPLLASQPDVEAAARPGNNASQANETVSANALETAAIEAIKEALPLRMVLVSLSSLFASLFVVAVDSTLLITLLNDVSTAFSSSDLVFWLGSSYTLAMCAVAPIYGRLNDIVGRKNAIVFAVSLFLFGTLLCTVAPSMLALIGARAVAGLGGGGILTCVAVILGDLVPLRKRGLYQAACQVIFSLGNAAGGPVGGLLSDYLGWRLAIATQLPILALALVLIIFCLRIPELPTTAKEQRQQEQHSNKPVITVILQRLDLLGSALLVLACLSLMFGLSFLSAGDLPLTDFKVLSSLLSACLFTALFIWVEVRHAKEPILPMALLRNQTIASAAAVYFLASVSLALVFYFPLYFRSVLLQSASETGIHLLPTTISTTVGAFFSGAWLHLSGRYKGLLVSCAALSLVTPVYLATWTETNQPSAWGQNLALVPMGLGAGSISSLLTVSVLAASSREAQAVTMGLMYLSRSLGSIIGVSVFGALLQYTLTRQLGERIKGKGAEEVIDKIRKNANIVTQLPAEQQLAARQSYSKAIQAVHISIIAVFFVCLVITVFVKEYPIESKRSQADSQATEHPDDEEDEPQESH